MSGVSVLLAPLRGGTADAQRAIEPLAAYLASTGFEFEITVLRAERGERFGETLRRSVGEAKGEAIVIVDADLPYGVSAIGDAVAMIQSGSADVVFGTSDPIVPGSAFLLRWLLVDLLPDSRLALKAFSSTAARLVIGEGKLRGSECVLEIAYLANKYGFRVEPLQVTVADVERRSRSFSALSLGAAVSIRMTARRLGYRASRRCPVCFANDVWTAAQIPGNLVRACSRCQCRYLNQFSEDDETSRRRVLRSPPAPHEAQPDDHSQSARTRTSARRLAVLKRHLPPRARLLEVGVRDGGFGLSASSLFEYTGIDRSASAVRAARSRGLEAYCATLASFVNTGPAFDAVALFHVFENMPDPHDALGRIKDLLKPGGVLFLTAFDTEGLLYLLTERKRMAQNFRTHLILYSRSALIELLEHSGFEIDAIGPDFEYRDHRFLRHLVASRWPALSGIVNLGLRLLPDPLLVGTGSIRVIARRRSGVPFDTRAIRSAEATHAR